MSSTYRALIIEDNPGDVRLVQEMLRGQRRFQVDLVSASTLAEGLKRAKQEPFDALLVDLGLPDSQGLDTFATLHEALPAIPTIILTGNDDVELAIHAVQAGAQDYLVKSEISASPLIRSLHYAIERKRIEEALRKSEARYRGIVETAKEGIAVVDPKGRLTFANTQMAAFTGFPVEEMSGRPLFDFMDPQASSVAAAALERTFRGSVEQVEIRLRRKDGAPIWTVVTTNPLKDEAGSYSSALVVVTDISDRYLAEEARRKLAAIVESSHDAIIGATTSGIIETWNTGAERMFGYAANEVIGKHVWTITPQERQNEFDGILDRLRKGESVESFETVRLTRNGRRIDVAMTLSLIRDAAGAVTTIAAVMRDITERKRIEERFRIAAETMSDVIYEWDLGTSFIAYGDVDRLLGYKPEEFPNTVDGWASLVHPEDYARVLKAIESHLRGEAPYNVEYRVRRKDGRYAVWIARGRVVRDERGVAVRWIGAVTDITARRQIEDALRASEENYRRLMDNIPDVTWTADSHGNVRFVSANVEKVYGFAAEEMIAGEDRWMDRIHPEDAERIRLALSALYDRGATFDEEYRIQRKDGRWIWIHDRSLGTYERNGLIYADGIFSDITRRKEAELAVHRMARELELLLESTGEGVVALDSNGICTMANRVASVLLGRPIEDLLGRVAHAVVHDRRTDGSPYPIEQCPIYETYRFGKPARITDEVFWRKDGTSFPVEYVTSPIIDEGVVRGAVVTFSDITERRRLERRLEQVSRIGSLGRMAAMIGHEFNNVLMGIQPFAEIVLSRTGEDPKLQRAATHILNSVTRGRTITQDIMRVTKPVEPALESVDINEWLNDFIEEIRGLLPQSVQLDLQLPPPGTLFALCDPLQMQQVITNMVLNGRDAMATMPKGTLTIEATRGPDCVRLMVSDTGVGIAAENLPFIFEPLFSTKKSGTGLGLSVAQQLVVRNGGIINVESAVGKGTRFTIELPEALPVVPQFGKEEHLSPRQFGVQRVVIVEDDLAVASGLAAVFESEQIQVRMVGLGRDAMAAVEEVKPDLVMIDISLPDMSGTAVYDQLAARWPGIPVIFSTAHADESKLPRATGSHVGFLRKPYGIGTLFGKIRELMGVAETRDPK